MFLISKHFLFLYFCLLVYSSVNHVYLSAVILNINLQDVVEKVNLKQIV